MAVPCSRPDQTGCCSVRPPAPFQATSFRRHHTSQTIARRSFSRPAMAGRTEESRAAGPVGAADVQPQPGYRASHCRHHPPPGQYRAARNRAADRLHHTSKRHRCRSFDLRLSPSSYCHRSGGCPTQLRSGPDCRHDPAAAIAAAPLPLADRQAATG